MPTAGRRRFKSVQLNVRIPGDIVAALRRRAVDDGQTIAKVTETALVRYLGLDPVEAQKVQQVQDEVAELQNLSPDAVRTLATPISDTEMVERIDQIPVTISQEALEVNRSDILQTSRAMAAESDRQGALAELTIRRCRAGDHPKHQLARHASGTICLAC